MTPARRAEFEALVAHARKVQKCVHIAAPPECADDVDATIGRLLAFIEQGEGVFGTVVGHNSGRYADVVILEDGHGLVTGDRVRVVREEAK